MSRLSVLASPAEAAHHYGSIRAALERQGRIVGVNDLHIAAHARSRGLTLVTNNLGEFERVADLLMENWLAQPNRDANHAPQAGTGFNSNLEPLILI